MANEFAMKRKTKVTVALVSLTILFGGLAIGMLLHSPVIIVATLLIVLPIAWFLRAAF